MRFFMLLGLIMFLVINTSFAEGALAEKDMLKNTLGVSYIEIDPFVAENYELKTGHGIYVERVKGEAGETKEEKKDRKKHRKELKKTYKGLDKLKSKDIITKINNIPVRTREEYEQALYNLSLDEPVEVTVVRHGKERILRIVVHESIYTAYPVIGNNQSNLYHRVNVHHAPEQGTEFPNRLEAERAKYRPCKICFPEISSVNRLTKMQMALGRGAAKEVESSSAILLDDDKNELVTRVGNKIAKISRRPYIKYVFRILETDEINAFACPNGRIYVTEGLVDACESEDELALVLAHEISHVTENHGVEKYKDMKANAVFAALLGAAASAATDDTNVGWGVYSGAVLFNHIVKSGYSKRQEKEADLASLAYVMKAGYNPKKARFIMKKLQDIEGQKENTFLLFSKTHPDPGKRVEYIDETYDRWSKGQLKLAGKVKKAKSKKSSRSDKKRQKDKADE